MAGSSKQRNHDHRGCGGSDNWLEDDEMSEYEHKHEFKLRPYVDEHTPDGVVEWCIVTKDNEGYDITVTDGLPEPLAKWMRNALNKEIDGEDEI